MDYDPELDEGQMESERAKEILDIELTKVHCKSIHLLSKY